MQNKKIRWNIIKNIRVVCNAICEKKFKAEQTEAYRISIKRLMEYFDVSEKEVWLLAIGVYYYLMNKDFAEVPFSKVAEFVDSNVLAVAELTKEFKNLNTRKLIKYNLLQSEYNMNSDVMRSILENKTLPVNPKTQKDYAAFINSVYERVNSYSYTFSTPYDLLCDMTDIEERYEKVDFVQRSKKLIYNNTERYIFYIMCAELMFGSGNALELDSLLTNFYSGKEKLNITQEYIEEKNILFKENLIVFETKGCMNNSTVCLTEKGEKFLLQEDYNLFEHKFDRSALKEPKDIITKELFYNKENSEQINSIYRLLEPENLKRVKTQLKEKGLSEGIIILLHGESGTGKTETVYQLAKRTNRAIVEVDISQTKSCWFGESEKKIKEVFTNYNKICKNITNCKKNENIPILLFNEADAVLSKRQNTNFSNTAQTENAIQNIILTEMEKFSGIMIATTNLVDNLDPAFERRFLYKLEFSKPGLEEKIKLWTSKLPSLKPAEVKKLSETFSFSGGEIDNIARKIIMNEIVIGRKPGFNQILQLCSEEKIHNDCSKRLGFVM